MEGVSANETATVLGGSGFVGSAVAMHLDSLGYTVRVPERSWRPGSEPLGHVIYAIGLTGDFRTRSKETVDAHAALLAEMLATAKFSSWLYLSSTRIYAGLDPGLVANEEIPVSVTPAANSIYDLSKLLGEALTLAQSNPAARVARLSNVIGGGMPAETFLGSVLKSLREQSPIEIRDHKDSERDFVALTDVVDLIERIFAVGEHRVYNVCGGRNVSNRDLASEIQLRTGRPVRTGSDGPLRRFPLCSNERCRSEFGFRPTPILGLIGDLASQECRPAP